MDGRSDRVIPPGQSEQVRISLSTAKKNSGPFTRQIQVLTNDAEHQKVSLECVGSVLVPFNMKPQLLNFGQVERNTPQQRTVEITRGDGGPLKLELAPLEHENVRAALREVEPGEKYELTVEVIPPWKGPSLTTNLTLRTGIPEVPQESIRVYARMAERLRASPPRFYVPSSVKESGLDLTARLLWSGDAPGRIVEATCSEPDLPVRVEEQNGQQQVTLHVPAGYKFPERKRPFVTLKTDDPEVPTLRLDIFPQQANPMRQPGEGGAPAGPRITPPPGRPAPEKKDQERQPE